MNGKQQGLKVLKPVKRGTKRTTKTNLARREAIKREWLDSYTNLNVRLRNAEFLDFSDQVEAAGLTNNRALRIAGFIEIDAESKSVLYGISRELGRIGVNIN